MQYSADLFRVAQTSYGLLFERSGAFRMGRREASWLELSADDDAAIRGNRMFDAGLPVSDAEVERLLRQCEDGLIDVKNQSVVAFGVTFEKSEVARDDEFKAAGNAAQSGASPKPTGGQRAPDTPYTRVGPRGNPAELFCKAKKKSHLFGPGQFAGIRSVETLAAIIEGETKLLPPWNVHEPEIGTIVTPSGNPVAFTVALDMSDRRDEGISPLLLTKAKIFWHGAGFGHWFTFPDNPEEYWSSLELRSWVERDGRKVWPLPDEPDSMSATQCRRPLSELCADVLDAGFVDEGEAAVFMSGTGIVPAVGDTFSLLPGDKIFVESLQLGKLSCQVALVPRPRRNLVDG